ncbi:MAG: hypothetical protein VX777_10125 [Chlamydiota bacterium]|nr:hypothetical protein [Chlamydiota bacterium]
MKDEVHHLKHVQKRVIRSARRNSSELDEQPNNLKEYHHNASKREFEVYDEVVPSDQQVPRAPGRASYH